MAVSRYNTHDEARSEYVEKMGAELGELFHTLSIELTWIHWRWKQYRTLFGDKESRIDLLNESAPFFFRTVQDVLFEDTLLAVARLVGPKKSMGHLNLTVLRLLELIEDPAQGERVKELTAEAKSTAHFATDWRNRHIAHRDLKLALKEPAKPLELASRELVEASLEALRSLLNHVQELFVGSTTAYDHSPLTGDAEDLLYVLRDGIQRRRDREAMRDRGEMHDDDSNPPPPV